jgi:hypothetical protein
MRKEEFSSINGSTIRLGRYKHHSESRNDRSSNLLSHSSSTTITTEPSFPKGLDQTKFGKGFARRNQSQILNPLVEGELQRIETYQATKMRRAERTGSIRALTLEFKNSSTSYDIISGAQNRNQYFAVANTHNEGIKCFSSELGPEAFTRGKNTLRESAGRYFSPVPSGEAHDYRQQVLFNDGLLSKKRCGVLEASKKDLASYGVEDQFSKSQYTKKSAIAQIGLNETRAAGKYTPRKVPNNPSGNEVVVRSWNTNVDLCNKAMQGAS